MAANNDNNDGEVRTGGIKDFIAHTNMIGNVIAAAASQKNSFEPLPFSNSSLFEDNYDISNLKIHINPHAHTKYIFMPKTTITVNVTAERKHGPHIFHPYIYTLNFSHGQYKWEVIRSYKEIKEAHKTLAKIVKQDLGRSCSDISKEEYKSGWPLFPTEHDHLVSAALIGERCKNLSEYLQRLLTYPPFRDHPAILHLLNVSPLSFISDLGQSLLEGVLNKRTGDNVYYGHLSQLRICCDKVKIFHAKRWFVLKDTYITYLKSDTNDQVGFVMLLDKKFSCKTKIKAGAYHALEIKNLQRSLVLKCKSAQQQKDWYERINYAITNTGRFFTDVNLMPNGSFAPIRKNQLCKWYVNASLYMEHVMHGINNAKEEIFITDWWLCPELFLKRPTDDLQYRLDKILLKKAKEGVRIYILLFKEVSFALSLLSSRAKNVLTQNGKNPNIKVLRHPEHSPAGVFLWSHHEKCVIIDQSIAFLGGIDLCFGRWDDDLHRLIDLGRKENTTEIDFPKQENFSMVNILKDIQKYGESQESPMAKRIDTELSQQSVTIETTDKNIENENNPNSKKIISPENKNNTLEVVSSPLARSVSQEDEKQPISTQNQITSKGADALIVAALMGNSINRFNRSRHKRITTQQSAPMSLQSPVFINDSLTSSPRTVERKSVDKAKSFNEHDIEMANLSSAGPNKTNVDTRNGISGGVILTGSSNNTAIIRNKNNTSNLTNQTITGSSKASKFKDMISKSRGLMRDAKSKSLGNKISLKRQNDLSLPTDPNEADSLDETGSISKKDRVKKKWNKFKKNVKLKKRHLQRRSSQDSSDYDSNEIDDDSDDETNKYEESVEPPVISNEGYYWIGKDYSNTYKGDFKDVSDFSADQYNRLEIPRMPWRDEALVIFGESARDLARHFIQRWNQCKREKVKQIDSYPFLLPKGYSEPFEIDKSYLEWFKDTLYTCDIQITRSLDSWSGGISETETSILQSYCDLIRKSEHFIYIENQFFVTTTDPRDLDVKNTIGLELVNRIIRAHEEKTKFRVYIVLPLLPGFDSLNAIQAVQFYNLRSINLGEHSIYKALKRSGISDPSEYITFHGMRNWTVLMGKLVQEIIYVHSKLMIVDDRHIICGSANINDRSMLGKRDSELAAVVHDTEFIDSIQNGKQVKVGKYAFSLRKKIFKLHLGIYFNNPKRIKVDDCTSDEFYNFFRKVSQTNTNAYDEVFKCLPSDNILNFLDLANYANNPCLFRTNPVLGKEKMEKEVTGFIVDFPLYQHKRRNGTYSYVDLK